MFKKNCLLWVIVGFSAILVVVLFSIVGGVIGYQRGTEALPPAEGWKSIGSPNTSINRLFVFSNKFECPPRYVILLITSEGKLLSSGVIQEFVKEWQWTDITNGKSWDDFPATALGPGSEGDYLLWLKDEGKEYQVGDSGEWTEVEPGADSPFLEPVENLAGDRDYQSQPGWQTPPGEISQVQAVTCHWADESPTWVFATLKESQGLWSLYLYRNFSNAAGLTGSALLGAINGCGLALLVVVLGTIVIAITLRRMGQ